LGEIQEVNPMASHEAVTVRDSKGVVRYRIGKPFSRDGGACLYGRILDLTTGKACRVATGETKKDKARQRLIDWCAEKLRSEQEGTVDAKGVLFTTAFEEWLSLKTLRDSTRIDMERAFRGTYAPAFGERCVNQVEAADIERFLSACEKKGNAPKTRRKHLVALRGFFRWAIRRKYARRDPTDALRVQVPKKRHGKALATEEARRLLAACREKTILEVKDARGRRWKQTWEPPAHLFIAVLLALYTGLRRGNIVRLRWRQVDLGKRRISIPAEEMKANADFDVPLHPVLCRVLKELLAGRGNVPADELVLGVEVKMIWKSFKAALRRADLPDIRWHDLRHTFSTWIGMEAPAIVVKQLLGHSIGDVTELYLHVPWEKKLAAVDALPDLLAEQSKVAVQGSTAAR
jgi:integrase